VGLRGEPRGALAWSRRIPSPPTGARAALATALSENVRVAAVIAMMSTLAPMLDGYIHKHTWMMMTPGLGRVADWPDVGFGAPSVGWPAPSGTPAAPR